MSWNEFPALNSEMLSNIRRTIDGWFRTFTRSQGQTLETLFLPLRDFLLFTERSLIQSPWPIVLLVLTGLSWLASRSWKITVGVAATLFAIGAFGMWENTMQTLAMTIVATVVSIVVGIPLGILMSRSDRVQYEDSYPKQL